MRKLKNQQPHDRCAVDVKRNDLRVMGCYFHFGSWEAMPNFMRQALGQPVVITGPPEVWRR